MNKLEVGTLWWAGNDRKFLVVEMVNDEDENTWVHYINTATDQEYSCYVDAFLQRFTRLPK